VELMEDWVIYVENIATQRFETLAHEMKVTKVAPDRVEKLEVPGSLRDLGRRYGSVVQH